MTTSSEHKLISLLADGRCHSGESLGDTLGISRAAIWKYIHTLQARGLTIHSIRGKGYQLEAPIELLDRHKITALIGKPLQKNITLHLFDNIDSTNHYLTQKNKAQQLAKNTLHICIAESQTAGRGRRGREWITPYASSLALSLLFPFQCGLSRLNGLSLVVGILIVQALQSLGAKDIKLKWPNDILWQGRKLAGILIELSGETEGPCDVVIGIGLNVSATAEQMSGVQQAWDNINNATQTSLSRNQLAACIIKHLVHGLEDFQTKGFSAYLPAWRQLDYLTGREVIVENGRSQFQGRAAGVSDSGDLLLTTETEKMTISAGDVSVRAQA